MQLDERQFNMKRQKIQRFGSTIGNFMPFDDNGIWVRWADVAPYIKEAHLTKNEAIYVVGVVAAWMDMERLLPKGVYPDWNKLEHILCSSKQARK